MLVVVFQSQFDRLFAHRPRDHGMIQHLGAEPIFNHFGVDRGLADRNRRGTDSRRLPQHGIRCTEVRKVIVEQNPHRSTGPRTRSRQGDMMGVDLPGFRFCAEKLDGTSRIMHRGGKWVIRC